MALKVINSSILKVSDGRECTPFILDLDRPITTQQGYSYDQTPEAIPLVRYGAFLLRFGP